MNPSLQPPPISVKRGPVEHERRAQIVEAARLHFRHSGYNKTSVAELAQAIGVSSGYVYRFFESKQAIGEAVCAATLSQMSQALLQLGAGNISATEKLRALLSGLLELGYELFIKERRMHELVANAVSDNWESVQKHRMFIRALIEQIVLQGRESGEFEKCTPIDQVVLAIGMSIVGFTNPAQLQQRSLQDLKAGQIAVCELVLRSLSPSARA